jgi:hypothetical protein
MQTRRGTSYAHVRSRGLFGYRSEYRGQKFSSVYRKRAQTHYVDVSAIRKIASVKGARLEIEVGFASSGMDAVDRSKELRGPRLGRSQFSCDIVWHFRRFSL